MKLLSRRSLFEVFNIYASIVDYKGNSWPPLQMRRLRRRDFWINPKDELLKISLTYKRYMLCPLSLFR